MVIGVANSRLFVKLAHAIGRSEWADDPRYQTNADRLAHREYLTEEIRTIIRQETKEHWMELFDTAGVPSAPILTIPEVLAQPQPSLITLIMAPACGRPSQHLLPYVNVIRLAVGV